jgi:virginiamycin B lyase
MSRHFWLVVGVSLGAMVAASTAASAQALSGTVSSAQEGGMEGVLVSLKKEGSTIATTVVSNDKGEYSFPADRIEPGRYGISIRAAGYVLDGPNSVEIAGAGKASADLKLAKARNITGTLSNAEWLISAPGSDNQKGFLTGCVSCHTLKRIFMNPHTPEEFEQIFQRMGRYYPGSVPARPQLLVTGGARSERPRLPANQAKTAAAYIYSVNLSNPDAKEYDFKTLPRPKGRSTHVIITEYDLARKEAEPHDVVVDPDGHAWYSDFGSLFVGELDPKTGKVTDYALPVVREEQPKGTLDLELDPSGNLWISMMYQSGIARIDRKTKEITTYPFPKEWWGYNTQASMVSPQHSDVDGKVWTNDQEPHDSYRLDVKTGRYENMGQSKDPGGRQISAYGMPTDYQNNLWQLEFGGANIGLRDAKTGQVTIYRTPTQGSRPRRGRVDEQNRLWFAEYGANAIGLFDPKTAEIKEYRLPTAWGDPYDVVPTKNATEVWTGSMLNDLVARLDTKTGEFTEYLLPRSTNIRRVFVQETGPRPVLWAGSNHGASIVRVEPLD